MDRSLLWGSLAVGLAGWLCAMLLPGSDRSEKPPGKAIPKPYWLIAGALPPLIFLLSLPTKPPFSEGQGLGWGFLIGGVAALLAAIAVERMAPYRTESAGAFTSAGPMFLAAATV